MAQRIDLVQLELAKPKRLNNGWMKVDARLTRTGVFDYAMPDGSVRRELRLPEEVFHADSLESFGLVPVTDEHPPVFLDASNTSKYSRGSCGGVPVKHGDFMRAPLLITDADLVAKLETGEAREVSNGYTCDVEEKAGVTADGQRYDGIQRNIRGNHIAIVPRGRAGPEARVRMDGVGSTVLSNVSSVSGTLSPTSEPPMIKMKIDGVDYEASEGASQAYARIQAKHSDEIGGLQGKLTESNKFSETLQAKIDALTADLKKKDAELKEMPAKVLEQAKARADLETRVTAVLGKKAKLDGLTELELQTAVVSKLKPEMKVDGKSEAYVQAMFDIAMAEHDDAEDETVKRDVTARRLAGLRDDEDEAPADDEADESTKKDSMSPIERMRADANNGWQRTVKKHNLAVG